MHKIHLITELSDSQTARQPDIQTKRQPDIQTRDNRDFRILFNLVVVKIYSMCFSAGASFTGAAIITAVGAATVYRTPSGPKKLFSAVPLIFGIQQTSEGVIWSILENGGSDQVLNMATIMFLIAALLIWPVMMPLSIWKMEEDPSRKKWILPFLIAGITIAVYYLVCMILIKSTAVIEGNHIRYAGQFPKVLMIPVFVIYVFATITPLFISSVKRVRPMGVLMLLSVVVSGIFYKVFVTSVWCFFAALISIVIYWILEEERKVELRLA